VALAGVEPSLVAGEEPRVHGPPRDRDHDPVADRQPGRRWRGARPTALFARALNEPAHRTVADHPGRFGFFANLPIPSDTEAALGELAYALDVLGAEGVNLTSFYGTGEDARYVGHDAFDPLWEGLDRRRAVVFLHGDHTPGSNRFPNPLVPIPVGEVPNETYKAAADLVTRGKKRRYHNIRIVLSHSGGSMPFLASRAAGLAHLQRAELSREEMLEDFAVFYYETALSVSKRTSSRSRASWHQTTSSSAATSPPSTSTLRRGTPPTSKPTSPIGPTDSGP
jgi:predicted TIM-barrel fold metal-dependent hydrolase